MTTTPESGMLEEEMVPGMAMDGANPTTRKEAEKIRMLEDITHREEAGMEAVVRVSMAVGLVQMVEMVQY